MARSIGRPVWLDVTFKAAGFDSSSATGTNCQTTGAWSLPAMSFALRDGDR